MSGASDRAAGNRLLAALPGDEYTRLSPYLEAVALTFKQVLYASNEPIEYVYFVTEGVGSLLQYMSDGAAVETATVGNEGMVGLPVFLGVDATPGLAMVQIPGAALRMSSEVLRREVVPGSPLHALLHRYTQALMVQMAQGVVCNRLHPIDARCARWLLQTHDRVPGNEFPLTQEFLAQMLGARRAAVNEVAGELQQAGLIRYTRGSITVVDRQGLEEVACECYAIIRDVYDRVFA